MEERVSIERMPKLAFMEQTLRRQGRAEINQEKRWDWLPTAQLLLLEVLQSFLEVG
jgi:hypothetical protein